MGQQGEGRLDPTQPAGSSLSSAGNNWIQARVSLDGVGGVPGPHELRVSAKHTGIPTRIPPEISLMTSLPNTSNPGPCHVGEL